MSSPSDAKPASTSAGADTISHAPSPAHEQTLVQYIVMRSDLVKQHKWNAGGLIANGSHAAVAAIADSWHDSDVQQYVTGAHGKQMHTVVLQAGDEKELLDTAALLKQNDVAHRVWIEQPDRLPSCLATRPYQRQRIQPLLRHLKLFR